MVEKLGLDPASEDEKEQKTLIRCTFWKIKTLYLRGEYKASLDLVEQEVKKYQDKYPKLITNFEAQENFSSIEKIANGTDNEKDKGATVKEIKDDQAIQLEESEVPEYILYIFMKYRLL